MKGILKFILVASICIPTSVFATQYCPSSLTVHEGVYKAPVGWHITSLEILKTETFDVSFFQAEYNYSWKKSTTTNNRISCRYYTSQYADIEITTDNPYPMPKTRGSRSWVFWKTQQSKVCGTVYHVTPEDCPWDEN